MKMSKRAVDSGTALQAGRSQVRFPMVLLEFFIFVNNHVKSKYAFCFTK